MAKLHDSNFAESRSQSKIEAFGHREKLSRPKISQFILYRILWCATMTFDPLTAIQFHSRLGSKTRSARIAFQKPFQVLWSISRTLKPAWRANFEWNWTVASGSHTYREVCSDAFEKLNQLRRSEASTKAPAAEVKLDQNKMSSQKNCTGL